eukprot:328550-Alexandrium_andersonii.AAC.2
MPCGGQDAQHWQSACACEQGCRTCAGRHHPLQQRGAPPPPPPPNQPRSHRRRRRSQADLPSRPRRPSRAGRASCGAGV